MKDLTNCKIWIGHNPELSKKVQHRAFELGYKWIMQQITTPKYINSYVLFFNDDKTISTRTTIITKDQFDEDYRKEILYTDLFEEKLDTELIVGKWYKTKSGSYVKYKETENTIFVASEYFMYHDHTTLCKEGKFGKANIKDFKEVSLEEIQQYLPEGHPDKIIKVKEEDHKLIVGEYYYSEDNDKSDFELVKKVIINEFNIGDTVISIRATITNLDLNILPKGTIRKIIGIDSKGNIWFENDCKGNYPKEHWELYVEKSKSEEQIPKYWFIENKYPEVRGYLANKYDVKSIIDWHYDYIGFDDCKSNNGVHGCMHTNSFFNNAKEITFEYFKKHIYTKPESHSLQIKPDKTLTRGLVIPVIKSKFEIGDKVNTWKGDGIVFGFTIVNTILIKGVTGHTATSTDVIDKFGNKIIPIGDDNWFFAENDLKLISKHSLQDAVDKFNSKSIYDTGKQELPRTPKVGDYVVITQEKYIDGKVHKLRRNISDCNGYWNLEDHDEIFSYKLNQFRFATDDEIHQSVQNGSWIPSDEMQKVKQFLSNISLSNELQLIKPKEDKRFDTSVNNIESVTIPLKQKSKTIKF